MNPSIAIITRLSFDKPFIENQRERFSEYINSLKFQINNEFTVYLLMDSVRNFKGCEENKKIVSRFIKGDERFKIQDTERFQYDIEVRLDFDDRISEVFTLDLLKAYKETKDNSIVSYQPTIIDCNTGDLYHNPLTYGRSNPSMCMALIQKGIKNFGVYDRPHNFMSQETGYEVIVRPEGFFFLQVHGENTLSQLPSKEYRYFKAP